LLAAAAVAAEEAEAVLRLHCSQQQRLARRSMMEVEESLPPLHS